MWRIRFVRKSWLIGLDLFLNKVITHNQNAFVKGRAISDNMILATNEVLTTIKRVFSRYEAGYVQGI